MTAELELRRVSKVFGSGPTEVHAPCDRVQAGRADPAPQAGDGSERHELAERSGMESSTLSRYESCQREIPSGVLQKIAEALGLTNDLLGYSDHWLSLE